VKVEGEKAEVVVAQSELISTAAVFALKPRSAFTYARTCIIGLYAPIWSS